LRSAAGDLPIAMKSSRLVDEILVLFVKVVDLGVVSGLCEFRVECAQSPR
jgi:hypothetical protein